MHEIIIIGGGAAAFTAALYAARRGLAVLVIAKDIGGQANHTDVIENYPGLEAVGGFDLVSKIRKQAEGFGAQTLLAEAEALKAIDSGFIVTAYGQQHKGQALILAYGKIPRDLIVPGEAEFKGRGISYCVTCDAPLFKRKIVAVVGAGDLNLSAALLAAKYAQQVHVLSKTDKLAGHPVLRQAIGRKSNITLVPFVAIQAVLGDQRVRKLRLNDLRTNQGRDLPVDGIFVELGYVVHSHLVRGLVDLDDQEQIKVLADQATSHPGIWAAGDCTNRRYKQAVISAGEGAAAALAAHDWLLRQRGGSGLTSDWTQIKRVKSR